MPSLAHSAMPNNLRAVGLCLAMSLGGSLPIGTTAVERSAGSAATDRTTAAKTTTAVPQRTRPRVTPVRKSRAKVTKAGPHRTRPGATPVRKPRARAANLPAAQRIFGAMTGSRAWFSGAFPGGWMSGARANEFAAWRGSPLDAVTMYTERGTYDKIAGSVWHIKTFADFPGRLSYGLPLIPDDGSGTLAGVAAGAQDWVWKKIASDLVANGRGNAIVRVGWEPNGTWWKWSADAASARQYRAAFRRVVKTMRRVAPNLVFDFDISCGVALPRQTNRLDSLRLLYPGDDVVDLIGCDTYDWWTTKATDDVGWRNVLAPYDSPGLADVADFARSRRKAMSVPEWGIAKTSAGGNGDNAFYIRRMHEFFTANSDVLAYEAYFNENNEYISSGLWESLVNPGAAAQYAALW